MPCREIPRAEAAITQSGEIDAACVAFEIRDRAIEHREQLTFHLVPAVRWPRRTIGQPVVGLDALHCAGEADFAGVRAGVDIRRAAPRNFRGIAKLDVGNFAAAELVELRRDDHEGKVATLAPRFEERAVYEYEVELAPGVAALAVAVQ